MMTACSTWLVDEVLNLNLQEYLYIYAARAHTELIAHCYFTFCNTLQLTAWKLSWLEVY
jgi:hypothetical protein